jgi:RNA-directed DNA polymerase
MPKQWIFRSTPPITANNSPKSVCACRASCRSGTNRHRGVSLERMIADLNPLLRGWAGFFGFSQLHELSSLDGWTRRRLRCVVWVQWKTRGRRYQELRRLKVPERSASAAIFSPKGPWRLSSSSALHRAFTNKRFKGHGLFSMEAMAGA